MAEAADSLRAREDSVRHANNQPITVRQPKPPTTGAGSWWVVPREQFSAALREAQDRMRPKASRVADKDVNGDYI